MTEKIDQIKRELDSIRPNLKSKDYTGTRLIIDKLLDELIIEIKASKIQGGD